MSAKRQPGARTHANREQFRGAYMRALLHHARCDYDYEDVVVDDDDEDDPAVCLVPLTKAHLTKWHLGGLGISTLNQYLEWWGDGLPAWRALVYAMNHHRDEVTVILNDFLSDPNLIIAALEGLPVAAPPQPALPPPEEPTLDQQRARDQLDDVLTAFIKKRPSAVTADVRVADVARRSNTKRYEIYRWHKDAGVPETAQAYLRRRFPELRERVAVVNV